MRAELKELVLDAARAISNIAFYQDTLDRDNDIIAEWMKKRAEHQENVDQFRAMFDECIEKIRKEA